MQRKIKIILLIAVVVLFKNQLFGQNAEKPSEVNCPQERIQVHISQESVFTGDVVGFKIYCSSPAFPEENISSLAFVELVSTENSSVRRKKILLKNGEGVGDFEVPGNIPTGIYYLLAYTNWMKNFGEASFFRKEILVINPGEAIGNQVYRPDASENIKELQEDAKTASVLKIWPDKEKYANREKVTVKIEAKSLSGKALSGDFSVSVYRKEPQMIFQTKKASTSEAIRNPGKISYLPDYKGIRLSGKLTDRSGKSIAGGLVTESTPGLGTDIKSSITDAQGNFNFLLKPDSGEKEIVLTMPGPDLKIGLEESFWNGFRNPPENLAFGLTPEGIAFLKKKFQDYQIQARFKKTYYHKSAPDVLPSDSNVFYSKPYQVVELKNYIKLDSLREYFYELFPSVKFNQRRGEVNISIFDPLNMTYLENKTGVFLDGVFYDDYSAIANMPVAAIKRIAVLPKTYYYKDFTFGGIVDIHTVKSDFNAANPLPGMTRFFFPLADAGEWQFGSPDYSVPAVRDRTPDFRYLLYWEPQMKVANPGVATVQFYTGDVTGYFVIKVDGMSEKGEMMEAESEFKVMD